MATLFDLKKHNFYNESLGSMHIFRQYSQVNQAFTYIAKTDLGIIENTLSTYYTKGLQTVWAHFKPNENKNK